MKFYFIRHGQTTNNSSGTHQGWGPIRLSELGRQQAENARQKFENVVFDKYYCSDLLRTQQTAELIFPEIFHAGKFEFDDDLREIDTGAFFGRTADEMLQIYGEEYRRCRHEMDLGIYGMESSEHLKERVRNFKKRLENEATNWHSDEKIGNLHKSPKYAIVTHGGIIRTFLLLTSGLPKSMIDTLPAGILKVNISNCSLSIFDFTPSKGWSIDSIGI